MAKENKCWEKRTRLEKVLTVLFVLSVSVLLVIFINALSKAYERGVCTSPECVRAATYIMDFVDTELDPCKDFAAFACGTFLQNAYATNPNSSMDRVKAMKKYRLKEIVARNSKTRSKALQLQRKFYRICLNTTAIDEDDNRTFKKLLDRLGGWPVIKAYNWDSSAFDWMKAMVEARRIGFPYNFFIRVSVSPVNKTTPNRIKVLSPAFEKLENEWQKNVEVMSEIASILGAVSVGVTSELRRTADFANELYKIIKKPANFTTTSVKNMTSFHSKVNWLEFLRNLTDFKQLTEYDIIDFNDVYLKDLERLLMRTSKKIQANYIGWYIILRYVVFLSEPIRTLHRNITSEELDRSEICFKKSLNMFPIVAEAAYVRKFANKVTRDRIAEMIGFIKESLFETLQSAESIDETTKSSAFQKLDALEWEIGGSEALYNVQKVDNYSGYAELNFTSDNIVKSVTYVFKNEVDHLYKLINENASLIEDKDLYHPSLAVNAFYSPLTNRIILPSPLLQDTIFNLNQPQYMNYGAMGSIIGHEISHAIFMDRMENNYSGFDKLTDCINGEYEAYLGNYSLCTETDRNCTHIVMEKASNVTLPENLADFIGIEIAYKGYQKWALKNAIEPSLPGVDFTSNQMFWMNYGTHNCRLKMDRKKIDQGHASLDFRINGPFKNNKFFAKDFQCSKHALMNPKRKCELS